MDTWGFPTGELLLFIKYSSPLPFLRGQLAPLIQHSFLDILFSAFHSTMLIRETTIQILFTFLYCMYALSSSSELQTPNELLIPSAQHSQAYASLIYDDSFLLGLRVLGKSLQDTATQRWALLPTIAPPLIASLPAVYLAAMHSPRRPYTV